MFAQNYFFLFKAIRNNSNFCFRLFKQKRFLSLKAIWHNSNFCSRPHRSRHYYQLILALDHSDRAMPTPAHFSLRPLRSGHLYKAHFSLRLLKSDYLCQAHFCLRPKRPLLSKDHYCLRPLKKSHPFRFIACGNFLYVFA